jgi:UDP-N-acetylglucosamine:LPS N-acetylglucosamine transferase
VSRVLILTASVGEGHDLPARTLADQLRGEAPEVEVVVEDGLIALGPAFVLVNQQAPGVIFHRFHWVWDAAFWLFVRFPPSRVVTKWLVRRFGSRGVLRLVERVRPDVIVSVYPMTTEVLGGLRRSGRLAVPVVAAITDLAAMHYWAAPGVDLHLVTHPESIEEVRRVAGRGAEVHVVHGLTRPEFSSPCDPQAARVALGLPLQGKLVLVSGGGWGVGDLGSAVEEALSFEEVSLVACLCGRNERLQTAMSERYGDDPRVRVVAFTEHMSDWLAAGDALVHSTAGLTVLEAYVRGCPTISFGWGRGHIRVNNQAFRRFGIAEVAHSRPELGEALEEALGRRRTPGLKLAALPSAASLVLALASVSGL